LSLCTEIDPPYKPIDYIGTSFGLTNELYNFWGRLGFEIVYLRQTASDITGEYSAIMLKQMHSNKYINKDIESTLWLSSFVDDFRCRFVGLLSSVFSNLDTRLALSIVSSGININNNDNENNNYEDDVINNKNYKLFFSDHDILRLKKYSQNLADKNLILDLVPMISYLLFTKKLNSLGLSFIQRATLLAIGCQRRTVEQLSSDLNVPVNQLMALFNRSLIKFTNFFKKLQETNAINDLKLEEKEKNKNKDEEEEVLDLNEKRNRSIGGTALPKKSFRNEQEEDGEEISKQLKEEKKRLIEDQKDSIKRLKENKNIDMKELMKYSMEKIDINDLKDSVKENGNIGKVSLKRKTDDEKKEEKGGGGSNGESKKKK